MEDFPVARNLLEADVDMPHLTAIEQAKERILRSPLSVYGAEKEWGFIFVNVSCYHTNQDLRRGE